MKLLNHIRLALSLGMSLAFLFGGSPAFGQGFQPPFMAPTPPSLYYGAFYFSGGAKYRKIDQFKFDVITGARLITVSSGTIPFGPATAGPFGVGTGKPGFIGITPPAPLPLTWTYDNGAIDAFVNPPGIVISCTGPPPGVCSPPDAIWGYDITEPELGRSVFLISSADCCNGTTAPGSTGSFSIVDPRHQGNNPNSIAGTTTMSFSLLLADSLLFSANSAPDINRVLDANVVGPSFEAGYQWSNYFDLFYGFSWFNVTNSIAASATIQGQGGRNVIQDTFPFLSDDPSGWPVFNFNSSDSVVNGNPNHIYHIAPNGPGNGVMPNRQFVFQPDFSLSVENIQENVISSAEFSTFENRFGGRSWVPLYGIGRLGATMGTAIIPTRYKISSSSTYIASGSSGAVAPGTVLLATDEWQTNWKAMYGLFVGGDLSLGSERYYLSGSADYMWASSFTYELGAVQTTFSPGGFSAGVNGGIRF